MSHPARHTYNQDHNPRANNTPGQATLEHLTGSWSYPWEIANAILTEMENRFFNHDRKCGGWRGPNY